MAHMTVEQGDVLVQLRQDYGLEQRAAIEDTREPYGVVRVVWNGGRSLFIRPDGSRLAWRTL